MSYGDLLIGVAIGWVIGWKLAFWSARLALRDTTTDEFAAFLRRQK